MSLTPLLQVRAPGKLILSGEHAVVYGHPALAMAVNRYVTASVSRGLLPSIFFDLADIAHRGSVTPDRLKRLKDRIKRKYRRFMAGEYDIRTVIQKPFELAQYAMSTFTDSMNITLPQGIKLRVNSDLPVGCGMGSSAATILAVMAAMSHYAGKPIETEALFRLALEAEHMQHGKSSGLDLRVALEGGCLFWEQGQVQRRVMPALPLYLVNTGTPLSMTGECVTQAAAYFKTGSLGDEFAAVTRCFDAALKTADLPALQTVVRENHQLLVRIGVVPQMVQQLIHAIEETGGSAKVCGAGAVRGDRAGAVLVLTKSEDALSTLCKRFGYEILPVACDERGVHVV